MYTRRRLLAVGTAGVVALSGCTEFVTGDGPLSEAAEPAVVSESALEETGYQLASQETEILTETVEVGGETREIEAENQIAVYERDVGLTDNELEDDIENIEDEFGEDLEDELDEEFEDGLDDAEDDELEELEEEINAIAASDAGNSLSVDRPASTAGKFQLDSGEQPNAGSLFVLLSTPAFSIVGQSFNPVGGMDNEELAEFIANEIPELTIEGTREETTRTVLGEETAVTSFEATTQGSIEAIVELTAVEHEDDIVIAVAAYPELLESSEADNAEQLFDGIEHPTA